jgi:hypothetical protein
VKLASGPHEVELRLSGSTSATETVQIASSSTTTLSACVRDGAVVTSGCDTPSSSFPVLGAVGGVAIGAGVLSGVVSVIAAVSASSTYEAYKDSRGTDLAAADAHRLARTTALVTGVAGGALVVAGAAAVVVELVTE